MNTADPLATRIYTTADGRTVVEQSNGAVLTLTAEQILTVISQLRACYDYCATWNQIPPDPNTPETQP